MLGLTDIEQIAAKLKNYGLEDSAVNRAAIRLIWNAWPPVANEYGSYIKSSNDKTLSQNAVAFRAKLAKLTGVRANLVTLICSAIVDAFMSGELDQKSFDPITYKTLASSKDSLNKEIIKSGGGSITDKLLAMGDSLKKALPWIKWGGIGIGVLALLFLGKPYLETVLKVIPKKRDSVE